MATLFPLFSLLPKELRLTIWGLALEPRIVELCFNFPDEREVDDEDVNVEDVDGKGNEDISKEDRENEETDDGRSGPGRVPEGSGETKFEIEDENQDDDQVQDDENNSRGVDNTKDSKLPGLDGVDEDTEEPTINSEVEVEDQTQAQPNNSNEHPPNTSNGDEDDNDDTNSTISTNSVNSAHTTTASLLPSSFYSPSPLPALLRVNSEARSIALAASLPNFPVESYTGDVYYNPEIDILYFPAWCWTNNVMGFEKTVTEEVKGMIRRVAIENLMWMSYWEEGTINDQITISQFKGLKDFLFATRELTQCGCCVDFDGPERGLVEFVEIGDGNGDETENQAVAEDEVAVMEDADSEAETDKLSRELRENREAEALGPVEELPVEQGEAGIKESRKFDYTKRYLERVDEEFQKIKEADVDWNVPKARFVRLKRGGEFVGDP